MELKNWVREYAETIAAGGKCIMWKGWNKKTREREREKKWAVLWNGEAVW